MPSPTLSHALLVTAGYSQLALVAGSLAIPSILGWRRQLATVRPLTRQVFWTYAGYIWCTNLGFGLVSAFRPQWLLDDNPAARLVCAYIAAYWGARLVIQFTWFDRSDAPEGKLFDLAEWLLVAGFFAWTAVYTALAMGWR